jgi:hypothetical protein
MWQSTVRTSHHGRGHARRGIEGLPHARAQPGPEVLSGHGRGREGDGDGGQEQGLHHAQPDAEAGLGRRSERPEDVVHQDHVHEHEGELAARGKPDAQHLPPHPRLGRPVRGTEAHGARWPPEVGGEGHAPDRDGDEGGEAGAGDTERPPGQPSEHQRRRQHDVDDDGHDLDRGGHLEVAHAPQGRSHADERELEEERGDEPVQVLDAEGCRGRVGGQPSAIGVAQREHGQAEGEPDEVRQDERLVEQPLRPRAILTAHGLSDQRRRAHAQRLREGEDQHHEVPAEGHPRDGLLPQLADEIQVGQEIQGLEGGAHRDEERELEDVPADGALREVLHLDRLKDESYRKRTAGVGQRWGPPPRTGRELCHDV